MPVDITNWTVPQIVLWRRGVLKLTQSQCAEGVCGLRTLRNIEAGITITISAKIRVALEAKLKLPPNSLLPHKN